MNGWSWPICVSSRPRLRAGLRIESLARESCSAKEVLRSHTAHTPDSIATARYWPPLVPMTTFRTSRGWSKWTMCPASGMRIRCVAGATTQWGSLDASLRRDERIVVAAHEVHGYG